MATLCQNLQEVSKFAQSLLTFFDDFSKKWVTIVAVLVNVAKENPDTAMLRCDGASKILIKQWRCVHQSPLSTALREMAEHNLIHTAEQQESCALHRALSVGKAEGRHRPRTPIIPTSTRLRQGTG